MAWPAVALALGSMGIVATMAALHLSTGTIELAIGVLVTPVLLALVAAQVGEQRGATQALQAQTNGTQSAMVQAMADQGAALTQLVHHLATAQTGQPAPLPTVPAQPAPPAPPG